MGVDALVGCRSYTLFSVCVTVIGVENPKGAVVFIAEAAQGA